VNLESRRQGTHLSEINGADKVAILTMI
jgi:hypothetical protein